VSFPEHGLGEVVADIAGSDDDDIHGLSVHPVWCTFVTVFP
jgi:hypothetical protein